MSDLPQCNGNFRRKRQRERESLIYPPKTLNATARIAAGARCDLMAGPGIFACKVVQASESKKVTWSKITENDASRISVI
jgi:hypothetical protein